MTATIGNALTALRPGAEWTLSGNSYAGINWLDAVQTKPTQQEVTDQIAVLEAASGVESTRESGIVANTDYLDLVGKLKTMTPAQWQSYLTTNMTNLTEARVIVYRMGLALMLLARSL